jgi:hypothetical protein
MKRIVGLLAVVAGGLVLAAHATSPSGTEEPSATLSFLVLKDYNGKPIRNAAVVLHPVNSRGKQARGGYELKTDMDGKTSFDGVPYGKLRVQVLAPGFQTFGEDYDIQSPTKEITVKLKRPQGQYSVYDQRSDDNKKDGK